MRLGQKGRDNRIEMLDVVALLDDLPEHGLAKGQVGTVVDALDGATVLVEFSDDRGAAYAIAPVPVSALLVLQYQPADA